MEKPFLKFYRKNMIDNPESMYLCNSPTIKNHPVFRMVEPNENEKKFHKDETYPSSFVWGCLYKDELKMDIDNSFNEFRQTFVLLCAAINNEL